MRNRNSALFVLFCMVSLAGCGPSEADKQPKVTIDPTKQRTFEIESVSDGGAAKGPAPAQPAQRDKMGK